MATRPRIAITGAAGVVAGVLIPALNADVAGVDIAMQPEGLDLADWYQGSVADPRVVSHAAEGCHAVLHLATGAPEWPGLFDVDMRGLRNVLDSATANGVRKVIFASSNHVVGMHEKEALRLGRYTEYPISAPPRPDSPYGAAKAFGEALCRYTSETSDVSTSCLRIGTVRPTDDIDRYCREPAFKYVPGGTEGVRARLRKTWLYHEDLIRIVREELESSDSYRLRFAVSNNPGRFWSLDVLAWNRLKSDVS
jgi:nucleoside-diphosphate-sugar epimerase